jgi:putative transposase
MTRFREAKTLKKVAATLVLIHNHINQGRYLNRREIFRKKRSAALDEWRHTGRLKVRPLLISQFRLS